MQQLIEIIQANRQVVVCLSFSFAVFSLFSKKSLLIKIPVFLSLVFVLSVIFYPQELNLYLGNNTQIAGKVFFSLALISLVYSVFKFFRASINIVAWTLIAVIAGSVAFPEYAKMQSSTFRFLQDSINKFQVSGAVGDIKYALTQSPSNNKNNKE